MLRQSSQSERTLTVLVAAALLVMLVAGAQFLLATLNSDFLYLPSLYDDLFVRRLPILGWVTPPASYLFPDFALLAALESLLPGLDAAIVAYAGVVAVALCFGIARLVRPLAGEARATTRLVFAAGLVAWLYLQITNAPFSAQLLLPSDHAGATLAGIWLMALAGRALQQGRLGRRGAAGMVFLSAATTASDMMVVSQFVAPLVAALAAVALRRRWTERPSDAGGSGRAASLVGRAIAAAAVGGALLGWLARELIRWTEVWHISPSPWHPEYRLVTLQNMSRDLLALAMHRPELIALLLAWTVLWLAALKRQRAEPPLYVLLAMGASLAATVLGPVIFGIYDNEAANRYLTPLYVIPALTLLPLLREQLAASPGRDGRAILAVAANAALAYGLWSVLAGQHGQLPSSYSQDVACLDQLADRYGVQYGYGDYWNAKRLSLLSRHRVRVNQLNADLSSYWWITDILWYYEGDSRRRQPHDNRFIITDRLDRNKILQMFAAPAAVLNCGGSEYFYYGRETDQAFRNYLPENLRN